MASSLRGRWIVAAASALALALLTLNAHVDDVAAAPENAACPVNAKPANLGFTLKDLANRPVRLSQFKGKVILLDFWATWCVPCKAEIPWFEEFQNKYRKDGLQVIGVSVDDKLDKL